VDLTIGRNCAYAYTGGVKFDPARPAVVFIHGAAADHSVWVLQSRYLAHHGFGVLALDLPGHGRSRGTPLARIEDMADWVVAALDAAGVHRAALVGHSMGSLIALDAAARHGERVARIALLATAFPMRVSPALLEAAQRDEPAARDMVNIWSHSSWVHYPNCPGPGAWQLGANLRLMERQPPGVLYRDLAACNDYAAGMERAAALTCPALLVLGGRDLMTPARAARALAGALPRVRTVTIGASGHNLMGECPDAVLDALIGFLADEPGAAAG